MRALKARLPIAHTMMTSASTVSNPQTAMVIREAYDSTAQRINNSVGYLAENGVPRIDPQLIPLVRQMISAGGGEGNVFQAMDARLNLDS